MTTTPLIEFEVYYSIKEEEERITRMEDIIMVKQTL